MSMKAQRDRDLARGARRNAGGNAEGAAARLRLQADLPPPEILRELRLAVDRAQAEGETFAEFLKDLRPRLQRLGWWGEQEILDPDTGEVVQVEVGPRRLRTIFDTNLTIAAQRGHWERIERLKDSAPYLRYTAVLDARTRPEHRAWDGIILPVDHPFWRTHYPPNGWRCRCGVTQWDADDLADRGLQVSPDPVIQTREWVNRRSGRVHQVPLGIDPGWDHNVGLIDRVEAARLRLPEAGLWSGGSTTGGEARVVDWCETPGCGTHGTLTSTPEGWVCEVCAPERT